MGEQWSGREALGMQGKWLECKGSTSLVLADPQVLKSKCEKVGSGEMQDMNLRIWGYLHVVPRHHIPTWRKQHLLLRSKRIWRTLIALIVLCICVCVWILEVYFGVIRADVVGCRTPSPWRTSTSWFTFEGNFALLFCDDVQRSLNLVLYIIDLV